MLAILVGTFGCAQPPDTRPAAAAMPEHRHADDGATVEPTLPPLLTIERDPTDSDIFRVQINPLIEGAVKIAVRGDVPYEWLTPPSAETLRLRRTDAPIILRLRISAANVKPASADAPPSAPPRISLVFANDDGEIVMAVDEPLPMPAQIDPSASTSTLRLQTFDGESTDGRPVRSIVPDDAPAPRVREDAP
jgi:hypothetical protein